MADWFETRFREPVDAGQLDPAFVARMRALVVEEWQADSGITPPTGTDPDPHLPEGDVIMLETEDRPRGHEPMRPQRRSPGRWLLLAAAAAVVALVGTLLVAAGGDDDDPLDTAQPTPTTAPVRDIMEMSGSGDLEPGRYVIDPDGDGATPLRVSFQVAADGWEPFIGAVKPSNVGHAGVFISTVTNLVTDGCRDHTPLAPPVGATVDDLATALTRLAPFAVTAPPTDVTLLGYPGKHLELTVPEDLRVDSQAENFHDFADCVDGEVHSWISTNNDGSFYGYEAPGYTEEFWILDVGGARLVLVQATTPGTPAEDLAERDAIFDSISIEP